MEYLLVNNLNFHGLIKQFLLTKKISQRTISQIRRGETLLLLNEHPTDLKQLIQPDDKVTLRFQPEDNPLLEPNYQPIEVLYEDTNWLAVNKPAGLSSVPGPSNRTTTLVNRVKGYLINQQATDLVPHVVTRLDRFTSGVVLLAKHHLAQSMIEPQVENHLLDKRYLAVVDGQMKVPHALIDLPIKRVLGQAKRIIDEQGQSAQTEYWVQKVVLGQTLVKVKLLTGRNHQIRVHFSHLGYPLTGDQLYGGSQNLIQRQSLHARQLIFSDPFSNKKIKVVAPLPLDLQQLIGQVFSDDNLQNVFSG
ncbi:RluA family pseudouridine synthase [Liquorilactobacillus vini]|uniref:Pseudouridine synthase n=1 Tax=Liquorilactobacillus vini DSM 20605 TaxID=1133569 RepID=A0A0R2C9K1_9LACO|nr:RluA family pseudouridine synthase [Liquorilactobacillus vini]KRM88481.1 RluA family pseudouridine synthase [Liquorilactobacillus vini DSM 20605]